LEKQETTVAYIRDLTQLVPEILDKYHSKGMLDGQESVPLDEVWIKIGGDHGGSTFKVMLQVANLEKPNSKLNTFLLMIANCKDNRANLKQLLEAYGKQIDRLQKMTLRGRTIRVFVFGDYDFLLKVYECRDHKACTPAFGARQPKPKHSDLQKNSKPPKEHWKP
jgi:hypothetical protein